nr:MAG TPA: hypothetical protein [Caudoviricetes sp.]
MGLFLYFAIIPYFPNIYAILWLCGATPQIQLKAR